MRSLSSLYSLLRHTSQPRGPQAFPFKQGLDYEDYMTFIESWDPNASASVFRHSKSSRVGVLDF